MDMIQDWMIINKIKMGDPDAWDILVHKYYDSVYFYCVRRCYGDCDIASDLTQDIFLKLVESLPRYRFIGKFQNYLYTMAVNTCNNYLKKRHIEQIELTDNFTTDLDTSLIDEILGVYILPLLLVQMIKTGVGNKILYLFPINNLNVQNILGIRNV